MEWPQITYLAVTLIGCGVVLAKHGEYKNDHYNAFIDIPVQCFVYWLLYTGGFFG